MSHRTRTAYGDSFGYSVLSGAQRGESSALQPSLVAFASSALATLLAATLQQLLTCVRCFRMHCPECLPFSDSKLPALSRMAAIFRQQTASPSQMGQEGPVLECLLDPRSCAPDVSSLEDSPLAVLKPAKLHLLVECCRFAARLW
ncbi:hypothetical protein BaRGS_00000789 [Batillaria attramentaria]|uniref:Uncharacterized protein n=1 Tax=Batillaria attramentaria TaxID=370345 RepID=A0ABD0M7P5_9CAEN